MDAVLDDALLVTSCSGKIGASEPGDSERGVVKGVAPSAESKAASLPALEVIDERWVVKNARIGFISCS